MDISISLGINVNTGSSTDSELVPDAEIFAGIYYGQSESIGAQAGSIDNTTSVESNAKSVNGDFRTHLDLAPTNINWTIDGSLLIALAGPTEQVTGSAQQTATREFLSKLDDVITEDITFQCMGKGGFSISALSAGTQDFYNIFAVLQAIQRISGKTVHPVLFFYHGAKDAFDATSQIDYENNVRQLRRDFEYQVRRIRQDDFSLQMYITQFTAFNYTTSANVENIALAQLEMFYKDANIHFVDPTYWLTFADNVHPNADGQKSIGTALAERYINQQEGLVPTSISDNGTVITVNYDRDISLDGSITPIGGDNGFRSDATITDVTLSGSTALITYTGSPTYISLAWNTASANPDDSNTDIIDSDNCHAAAFKYATTWSRTAEETETAVTYSHTLESWEENFALDCMWWFCADSDLADGDDIKCKAKSGCDFEEKSGAGLSRTTINSRDWIVCDGSAYFETKIPAQAMGTHMVICVIQDDVLSSVTKMIMANFIGANEPYFGTYDKRFRYYSPNAGGSWIENILVAGEPVVLSASFNSFTNEYVFRKNDEALITGTAIGIPSNKSIFGAICRILADGRYTPATNIYDEKVASISMHNNTVVGSTRHDTMVDDLMTYYSIT